MKSTEGIYYPKLDHMRALAAYTVFMWHFLHFYFSYPFPQPAAPFFPVFSIFEEGHTGVSLFMVLSGYLFTKITRDRSISYPLFLWSRAVRLGPLLLLTISLWVILGFLQGRPVPMPYILLGPIFPSWPGGAWSVTVEIHFYLLFPLLLLLQKRFGQGALIGVLGLAIILRIMLWAEDGNIRLFSYNTIVGRIDQFILGMIFANLTMKGSSLAKLCFVSIALFIAAIHAFNLNGGYDGHGIHHPMWIVIPTIEGIAYATLIAWYDRSSFSLPSSISGPLARIGEWSYSIYLLHFFFRQFIISLTPDRWLPLNGFTEAFVFANACFIFFLPVAAIFYYGFERPFFRFRKPYFRERTLPLQDTVPATLN